MQPVVAEAPWQSSRIDVIHTTLKGRALYMCMCMSGAGSPRRAVYFCASSMFSVMLLRTLSSTTENKHSHRDCVAIELTNHMVCTNMLC